MKFTRPRGHTREGKSPQASRRPHHRPRSSAARLGCAGRACRVVQGPCGRCGGEPATSCGARWAMRRRACHVVRCPSGEGTAQARLQARQRLSGYALGHSGGAIAIAQAPRFLSAGARRCGGGLRRPQGRSKLASAQTGIGATPSPRAE